MPSSKKFHLDECRYAVYHQLPYLRRHMMSLLPVESAGLGTFAMDQYGRLYYDPALFDEWTLKECGGVCFHELLHDALGHCEKAMDLFGDHPSKEQLEKWNIACDMVVNTIVRDAGFKLPEGCVWPKNYNLAEGLTELEYYDALPDTPQQQNPPGGQGGQSGQDDGGDSDDDGNPSNGPPEGGSCSDGQPRDWEQGPPSPSEPGMSKVDKQILQKQTAKDADEYAKTKGTVPGAFGRLCDDILRPTVDPKKLLQAAVRYAVASVRGHQNLNWKRPARRQVGGCAMLPSRQDPLPKVSILADTSASMNKKDLSMALGVIDKVLGAHQSSITVFAGDATLGVAQDVFDVKKVKFDEGGGGTDMGGLATQIQNEHDPDVIIICTDGETNWPEEKLRAKTVACITRESDNYPVPSWMSRVQLEIS